VRTVRPSIAQDLKTDLSGRNRFQLARLPFCLGHSDLNISIHPKQKRKQSIQRKTFQMTTFELRYVRLCRADQRRCLFLGQRAFFDDLDDVQRQLSLWPVFLIRKNEGRSCQSISRTSPRRSSPFRRFGCDAFC
jgi:hypothetical protein